MATPGRPAGTGTSTTRITATITITITTTTTRRPARPLPRRGPAGTITTTI